MERGKEDRIVIIRDEVSKQPKVEVIGLWNGKDRHRIGRMLLKEKRTAAYKEKQFRKQADQETKKTKVVDPNKEKRMEGLKKYWAAKKLKKLEEEKKDVRGQNSSSK